MVDVSAKPDTSRVAVARGVILMSADATKAIRESSAKKGDVLAVARVAGIMAAKRTSELIPLCHPLALTSVSIDFSVDEQSITATATTKTNGPTGVEMEALNAVSVVLLTLYDMVKAIDKSMQINEITLLTKSGGKSGDWKRAV